MVSVWSVEQHVVLLESRLRCSKHHGAGGDLSGLGFALGREQLLCGAFLSLKPRNRQRCGLLRINLVAMYLS